MVVQGSKAERINAQEHTVDRADVLSHHYETVLGMRTICVSVSSGKQGCTQAQDSILPHARQYSYLQHTSYPPLLNVPALRIFIEALVQGSRYSIRSNYVSSREWEPCGCHLVVFMQGSAVNSSTKRYEMLQCSCSHHRPNCLI